MAYWNGLPVIHDKIAKRYLIIMSEGQFESLIKAQEEELKEQERNKNENATTQMLNLRDRYGAMRLQSAIWLFMGASKN
ncbi:MAG: hypothetical protein WC125_08830 [Bacteroidales bacterium]